MAYKTRKPNKRKHLIKSYSKKNRRMYGGRNVRGGDADQSGTNVATVDNNNDSTVPTKETPTETVPTLYSNAVAIGNVASSAVANAARTGINSAAEFSGIDPLKTPQANFNIIGDEIQKVTSALNTPEGEKLKDETGKLLAESLDVLEPSIEKAEDIAKDGLVKLGATGTSMAVTALNEIPPVFVLNEASKAATALFQAGETVAKLTTTGAEAVKNVGAKSGQFSSLLTRLGALAGRVSADVNSTVADQIASVKEGVDEDGKQIIKDQMNKVGGGDKSMKKLQNEASMIGGRVLKSQLEFLTPYVIRSQILGQYGLRTKRRQNKRSQITKRR